jgi:hypothetical protein
MTSYDVIGALSIVWGFLVAILLVDWLFQVYTRFKG